MKGDTFGDISDTSDMQKCRLGSAQSSVGANNGGNPLNSGIRQPARICNGLHKRRHFGLRHLFAEAALTGDILWVNACPALPKMSPTPSGDILGNKHPQPIPASEQQTGSLPDSVAPLRRREVDG